MVMRRAPELALPGRSNASGRLGVTLFELLIVIVMIGILSAIAMTRLDWKKYQADAAGRGVMAELASAQRLALSLGSNVVVTLPDSGRMQILEDANDDGAASTGERVRTVPLDNFFSFGQGSATAVGSPDDGTALTTITFHRDGSADRSGTFYVHGPNEAASCVHCRAISISRATGRVVWYTYATGSWKRAN